MTKFIAVVALVGVGIAAAPMIEEMFDAPASVRYDADYESTAAGRPDVSQYDRVYPDSYAGPAPQTRVESGDLAALKRAYDNAYKAYQKNPTRANYERVQAAWSRLESAKRAYGR